MVDSLLGQRKIIHVDMDCFYAAVEVKYRPSLKGKPIGIGGPPESRSVLCTASYEARKFKVRSAMPSSQAVRLCPQLILIPPNFELYKSESKKVQDIFYRFTDRVEPLSLDEAYLDVTNSPYFHGSATFIAQEIKRLIHEELELAASAGVAPNKFLAKIASDWKKPNGLFVIRPDQVTEFVRDLEVGKIPGVGKVTEKIFHSRGIYTCGDLQKTSNDDLKKFFGTRASYFRDISLGKDLREVEVRGERKSLSVESTFSKDITTKEGALKRIPILFQDWQRRFVSKENLEKIRGHQIKVKYHDFKVTTHELSSKKIPNVENFEQLFSKVWEKRSDPIRLIGLGVRLESDAASPEKPMPLQLSWNW
jgi:DNA polymerase IV